MKRKIVVIFAVVVMLFIILWTLFPYYGVYQITHYEPYTFEKVLSDTALVKKYAIEGHSRPEDYGFESEEIDFRSLDSLRLSGWYIPAKKATDHCLILVHGRTSNRLKTMKYLALVDSLGLGTLYNIFIPDLRNSGKSEEAPTFMGYKFAEDVVASMLLVHDRYEQDTFLLYGFSMGAMAILNATGRPDLRKILNDKHLAVEGIILDSPLANVKETIKAEMETEGLPTIAFSKIYDQYSSIIHDYADSMKLSVLRDPSIPMLILQSEDDGTTRAFILKNELKSMKNKGHLTVKWFQGPGHVRIFQYPALKDDYIKTVGAFVRALRAG